MEQQTHLREGEDVEPAAVDGRGGLGIAYPRRRQRRIGGGRRCRSGDVGILDIPVLERKEGTARGMRSKVWTRRRMTRRDEEREASKFHSPRNKVGLGTLQSHEGMKLRT